MKLVLASQSPRRSELLRSAGFEFTVRAKEVDESLLEDEEPEAYVQRLAQNKSIAVAAEPGELVLAADTVVVIDGEILGKPRDAEDATRMLRLLEGRRHEVMTGIALRAGDQEVTDWSVTRVWMTPMGNAEIADYVASGEPMDKAGAYAIQGLAARYVDKIEGSYTNVVGLPVALFYHHWREWASAEPGALQ